MAENGIVLLRRFVEEGDAEAFAEIVRRHAGLVYGACLRILNDRTTAADAVQDTFTQLLRDAEKVTESVPCWLHRVATRKSVDLIRRDSSRRRREARYAAGKMLDTPQWDDISLHIDKALNELDDETRSILISHFFEGRTTKDIAADNAISQPTASRRIESGVMQLRTKLHNRGILMAAGALSSLLAANAAEAAPAIVMKELGKIALAGAKAAAASTTAAASTAATVTAKATTTAAVTTLKAKMVTVAAVALAGIGGVITYQYAGSTTPQPPTRRPTVTVTSPPRRTGDTASVNTRRPAATTTYLPRRAADIGAAGNQQQPRDTIAANTERPERSPASEDGGPPMIGGSYGGTRTGRGGFGGSFRGAYNRPSPEPPQDPNTPDSNSEGKTMVMPRAK